MIRWVPPSLVTGARILNERTLEHHAARVSVPGYDRRRLAPGVVHVSVGSFHRAHQAVYFDDLARRGLGDGWALTGVGMHRRQMRDALSPQDGLYTVLARDERGEDARVVGIITRYLYAPEQTGELLDRLTAADTKLVTLTITANGYTSRSRHPDDGGVPTVPTVPALLAAALERRRRLGRAPFTVLSCDNIADNGSAARAAVLGAAALRSDRLATWIDSHGAFRSSMVDRITPSTTPQDRAGLARDFGVCDRWPVVAERFSQWVIEDAFCGPRPPLEEVGAQFVADVTPYTTAKTRLLNASHCALGYLGSLAGRRRVSDALADPLLAAYVGRLMDTEIVPVLPHSSLELHRYAASIRRRLRNSAISDPLARLCRNGSSKVPAHLLPSIRDARAAGRSHPLLTLAVAAWCRLLRGGCPGASAALGDPEGERLRALARDVSGGGAERLLADAGTFGALGRAPRRSARDLSASAGRGACFLRPGGGVAVDP